MKRTPPDSANVVLLAAVEDELRPLRCQIPSLELSVQVHFVLTGVGKVAAACEAALALERWAPILLLQTGCAGAFKASGLALGDVVVATEEVLGDEGVETPEGFLDLKALGLSHNVVPTHRPQEKEWEELERSVAGRFQLQSGRLLTVSTGSGTDERAQTMANRWSPLAESMEGGAVALVANRYRRPFFEFRGISNFVGNRRREEWDVDTACQRAALVACRFLQRRFSAASRAQ